ncbi:hypothetical protein BHE97_07975 [Aeromicrobium sp. PE09-221]|uniref:hypothetical protein n=1 Tax=Aeromicrobium sp. PE09-221 TaxID=1898043 RepID=UPI000B3E5AB7|nr:hypothetical protein [Aeromicrobium sp. PE09-221]OUZ10280.1 hypothetical protein BHE97_07975 [Aeromicrobium sp. PE09-221]
MVHNKAAGDWINAHVWRHRVRLRLQHVIWWQRITLTTNRPGVARLMADRGNSTANHKDHPYILLNPGRYRAPKDAGAQYTVKKDTIVRTGPGAHHAAVRSGGGPKRARKGSTFTAVGSGRDRKGAGWREGVNGGWLPVRRLKRGGSESWT